MSIFDFFRHKEATKIYEPVHKKIREIHTLSVYTASDTGKVRQHNEDNYFADDSGILTRENSSSAFQLTTEHCRIFAVCDGMGGESFGDVASRISVETFSDFIESFRNADVSDLHNIVNKYASEANNRICQMTAEQKCRRSGSTLAMVCICQNMVYSYNIGDSRVYYFSGNKLTQITEDQTLAIKKLKANIYTEEEAKNSPDSHKITSFIGVDDRKIGLKALAYTPFKLNGKILICSDGLTDMCSDAEIMEILASDSENPALALVNKALENGGEDNVTCIVINQDN